MNLSRCSLLAGLLAIASVYAAEDNDEKAPPNGVVQFRAVKEVVDLIPKQTAVQLRVTSQAEEAKNSANAILAEKALHKWVVWKVKVESWEPWDSPGVVPSKFRITTADHNINVSGTTLCIRRNVYLGADQEPIVTKLKKGEEIIVTSFLNRADITINKGEGIQLNFDMMRSKIAPKE